MRKLFAVMLLTFAPAVLPAQDVGLPLGSKPAAVRIADINGQAVDLGQYIGKQPVMLEFWATWCPLCRALEPQMRTLTQRYGKRLQVFVVAVGVNQNPRSIKRHLEKHPLPGIVLWDGDGAAVRAFNAPGTSYVVVLDRNGKVVYTGSGSEQKLASAVTRGLR